MKKPRKQLKPWNYSELKARTVELGKTDKAVAIACKVTPSTYNLKLNGRGNFLQEQISDICEFLCIDACDILAYFFAPIVWLN